MADVDLVDFFGAQFRSGGRGNGLFDCQGLFLEVMRRYGHDVQERDTAEYATEVVAALIAGEEKSGKWQRISQPEEGCAVTLALDPDAPEKAQHLGVYVGDGRFIHILKNRAVTASRIDDRFFCCKIRGYYRWIG